MPDNVLQTLQQLVQDVIAPDVRELKVRMTALERSMDDRFHSLGKSMDERFYSLDERFRSLERQSEAQFKAIMAAIGESRAQAELATARGIAALSERVTALEARRQ